MNVKLATIGLASALFAPLVGCASERAEAPPPELPPAGADGTYEVKPPEMPSPHAREIQLELVADLARCDVEAPRFPYDETKPLPQDIVMLRELANCLNSEPFDDYGVILVGRADARGTEQYNEELGEERAQYVKDLLVDYGVDGERIVLTSEGEQDSIGERPIASHGYDRRVDVIQLTLVAP